MAILTEDIETISRNASIISIFFVNVVILLGCILYMALFSIPVAISIVVFLVIGTGIYQKISKYASYYLKEARELQDCLFQNFHIITENAKELKINRERRKKIFYMSWGNVFLFIPIGLIVFVLPQINDFRNTDLYNLIVTFIFLQNPIRVILGNLSQLNQASISLEKIESLNLLL